MEYRERNPLLPENYYREEATGRGKRAGHFRLRPNRKRAGSLHPARYSWPAQSPAAGIFFGPTTPAYAELPLDGMPISLARASTIAAGCVGLPSVRT